MEKNFELTLIKSFVAEGGLQPTYIFFIRQESQLVIIEIRVVRVM